MSRGEYPDRDPQLFYELARDRLGTQLSMMSALDTKIGLLVGLGSGLLGILAAVFALVAPADADSLDGDHVVLLVAAGVPYVWAAYHGIRALWARAWR